MRATQFQDAAMSRDAHRDAQDVGNIHPLTRTPDVLELDSVQLLRGQRELRIRHGNEIYRLRHTRNDKLILTK